jgi:hypothetical protein
MKAARFSMMAALLVMAALIAGLFATLPSPAFAAARHKTAYGPYGYGPHAPVRITIYKSRWDFSRYIDPVSGMYCRNTGWAAECVPPQRYWQGVDCVAGWPFPVCRRF